MKSRNTIGHRVREARELRGLSQADLASLADVPLDDVTSLEDGTWRPVDHETVGKLARAMRCTVADLLWTYRDTG